MYFIDLLLLITGVLSATGLECRNCITNIGYRGEAGMNEDCYDNPPNIQSRTCTGHCYTQFTIIDGIPTAVSRRCSEANLPTISHLCVTSFSSEKSNVATTTCSYYCSDKENCNDITTRNLFSCPNNCGYVSKGYCDYFKGTCVCLSGYSGFNCSIESVAPPVHKSCVQCNGVTDESCETETQGSTCPEPILTQPYCSASKISTIDGLGNVVREVVTRGCTAMFTHEDECFFSNSFDPLFSNHTEFTCTTMCDRDNCNVGIPNGEIDGNEETALYCLQCTDPSSCNTTVQPTRCPTFSTYCLSTVVYYLSLKTDPNYKVPPGYVLKSVVRECSSDPAMKGCQYKRIGSLNAQTVTCSESCQIDGCNYGWPGRPSCSSCSSSDSANVGYNSCMYNPPLGIPCPYPYQTHCFASVVKPVLANRGYIVRGCSSYDIGNSCEVVGTGSYSFQTCNQSCTIDNCNLGLVGSASLHHSNMRDLVFSMSILILSNAALCY